MITKIAATDRDALHKVCAMSDFLCTFFTIESNEQLLQVEITNVDGSEIRPEYAYHLGRMQEIKSELDSIYKK